MFIEYIEEAFWLTATQLVELLVPIIGIILLFSLTAVMLFGRRA